MTTPATKGRISESGRSVVVGQGAFRFEAQQSWERLPAGWQFGEAVGAVTDSQDRVFVFTRGERPVIVLDRGGNCLGSWGEGLFVRPHGITMAPDDTVYCVDAEGHAVRHCSLDGKLLRTIGPSRTPCDTGMTSDDFRTIQRGGPPYNMPTNLAIAPNGDLYVSDGYCNARIHKFSPDGKLLLSWGEPGTEPGQFNIPHGIHVDSEGTVYVADRENSRLQLFDADGKFLEEWTDIARPCEMVTDADLNVYVAEIGYKIGMWPGIDPPTPDATGARVSIFDRKGRLLARWGGGEHPSAPGDFVAAHDIWVDSRGDLYVCEVTQSTGAPPGRYPHDPEVRPALGVTDSILREGEAPSEPPIAFPRRTPPSEKRKPNPFRTALHEDGGCHQEGRLHVSARLGSLSEAARTIVPVRDVHGPFRRPTARSLPSRSGPCGRGRVRGPGRAARSYGPSGCPLGPPRHA
jgi:hypothetical protein